MRLQGPRPRGGAKTRESNVQRQGSPGAGREAVDDARAWRLALALTAAITAVRLLALFSTELNLYPDEAQYWLWSRELAFGYFSKPPLIAWIIAATTAIGGDSEAWVRLGAPLLQAGAALAVFVAGRRLYDSTTALLACALYTLMPGVQLSSAVIATDAPLMLCAALALLAYAGMLATPAAARARRLWLAAAFGAALGLAFLAKYAAIYLAIGFLLHLAVSRPARRAWDLPTAALAGGLTLLVLAPNLAWNATHQFHTLEHTAANANWRLGEMFNLGELADFVGSQFGVFGPVPFAVLLLGAGLAARRRSLSSQDLLLLCLAAPPLLSVALQAFLSRANANWASVGYVAGSVLAAAWLVRWRARGWIVAGLAVQGAIALVFLACVFSQPFAERIGMANAFKRAKGWEATTQAIVQRAELEHADRPLSAVAIDDRFLFNTVAYYGRDYFGHDGAPPLLSWRHEARPQSQAEAEFPLTQAQGARVLGAALEGGFREEFKADFAKVSGVEIVKVSLDRKRSRRTDLFLGEDFRPVPRDPVTGQPPDAHTIW
jgi:4-amino-4-deoxy-L-arabinose transferase-like glycosyltransferase